MPENRIELCLDLGNGHWAEPVQAPSFNYHVVAAKKPGEWILRGIGAWSSLERIVERMRPYTLLHGELEWTFHTYSLAGYMVQLMGDREGVSPYFSGLYLFRVKPEDAPDVAPSWMKEEHRRYDQVEKLVAL